MPSILKKTSLERKRVAPTNLPIKFFGYLLLFLFILTINSILTYPGFFNFVGRVVGSAISTFIVYLILSLLMKIPPRFRFLISLGLLLYVLSIGYWALYSDQCMFDKSGAYCSTIGEYTAGRMTGQEFVTEFTFAFFVYLIVFPLILLSIIPQLLSGGFLIG